MTSRSNNDFEIYGLFLMTDPSSYHTWLGTVLVCICFSNSYSPLPKKYVNQPHDYPNLSR